MAAIIGLIAGLVGGFLAHALSMKISFKHRTIENKIKVYDALIKHWVRLRNVIYAHHPEVIGQPAALGTNLSFDREYGDSQALVAEAILLCEDQGLTDDINALNERFYRTEWSDLKLDAANGEMEKLKSNAFAIVGRMRNDIKAHTVLERSDFSDIISGLWKQKGLGT